MKLAKFVALLGALAQGGILVYGFTQGDFAAAGQFFFKDPWGIVSLVDVYVGFMFFSAWVIFREKNLLVALLMGYFHHHSGQFPGWRLCVSGSPKQRRFLEAILDGCES